MPDQAEKTLRSRFPHRGLKPAVLALAMATAFGALSARAQAQALPSGGVAVHGQALITQPAANQLRVVTQNGAGTNHSAINWQSFSISAGAAATIVQPTASSLSINRVVTNTPSAIFGNLSSNGRLVLVNQSGIAVGAGAVIDTAGFTASALRMSDADALAGRLRFGEPGAAMGGAAGLTVGGRITARDGDIVLVAPNIDMGGSALLQAPNGSTILAAGQQVEITGRGLEGITMVVQAPTDQARNLGRLEGNAVGIFAGTLRHSGDIRATTASLEGGTVVLRAAGDAYVDAAGSIEATGTRGGKVDVLGSRVALTDQAAIDVSGDNAGGSIRIGGDFQGRNPDIPNAQKTFLGPQATLRADATGNGDGGRVIVWSDDYTQAHGTVSARGGLSGGNGGFVEVSGKRSLAFSALVDTRAPLGLTGTLLLDPDFINIELSGSSYTGDVLFGSGPPELAISAATINASPSNVILQANEDINFNVAVSLANPGVSLTARAGGFLRVNGSITTKGGAVNLTAGDAGSATNPSEGSLYLNQPIDTTGGGAVPAGAPVTLTSNLSDGDGNSISINGSINAGSSLSFTAAGGFTVNAPVNALGTINATVINDFVTTINRDVIAGGTMTMNLAGGLELPAVNQSARLGAGTGQTINAKYVALTVAGSGTSEIYNLSGPQTITTSGQNANGEGLLIRNTGNGNDTADIYNNGGAQTITVNNASAVRIQGISGAAEIGSAGDQTILIRGNSSLNALEIGMNIATGNSEVWGNNQTITVGEEGQSGSITIRGGVLNNFDAGINNDSGNQTIKTSGAMALYGGTAEGVGLDCVSASGAHGGSCAYIASDTGVQTLVAGDIRVFGGTAGSLNLAGIINFASTGSQLLEIEGGGDLVLSGGGGIGTGNRAVVRTGGTSQAVSFLAGGDLKITGGTVGTAHRAQLQMINASGTQTVSGATGIQISGGVSGGGFDVGNRAQLSSAGSQAVSVGSGGIQLTGGGGTGVETDNDAQIYQGGATGTTQSITVSGGGSIQMTGGSSELVNVGGAGHGSRALIEALGDSQTIHFAAGGAINLTGGTLGSRAFAIIEATTGSQSITGGPSISLVGGASGGFAKEGNRARIGAAVGVQTIVASDILLDGGFDGLLNSAELSGAAGQNITASGGITLRGGNGSGNHASIWSSGSQQLTVGNGGISILGGGGSQADNYADIEHTGSVGNQLITVNGVGNISLQAGSALGGQSEAAIRSDFGASQTILFTGTGGGRAINLIGGTAGPDSYAEIYTGSGVQLIEGAGWITLTGGASGGGASFGDGDTLGNLAGIVADSNHQTIVARGMVLQGGAGGLNNFAAVFAGGNQSITLGADGLFLAGGSGGPSDLKNAAFVYKGGDIPNTTQTIRIGGGGTVTLLGGSASGGNVGTDANLAGLSNGAFAAIRSEGVAQLIEFTEPGGSIEMTGGTVGSANTAFIEAMTGSQTIQGNLASSAPAISLTGGASGGFVTEGNRALIGAELGFQNISAGSISIAGGVGGTENLAAIRQGGVTTGLAETQTINIVDNGNLLMQGGGGATNLARIQSYGVTQTVNMGASGALSLTGGTGASWNFARIEALNGDQFVTGSSTITITGGAAGGTVSSSTSGGNFADLRQRNTSKVQSIVADSLTIEGGAAGTENGAFVRGDGNQTVTADTVVLQGGATGTDNLAQIIASQSNQVLNIGSGGLSLSGGGGNSTDRRNMASVFQGGTTGKSQTITVGGGGNITLVAGDSAGVSVGLDNGSLAYITNQGDSQLIEFSGAGSTISITGGTTGSFNEAGILARFGSQTIGGTTVGNAPGIFLTGGASGGQEGEPNKAQIRADGGAQTISARIISLQAGADGTGNTAGLVQGTTTSGLSSNQSITITGGGALSLLGGGGVSNWAEVRAHGALQTIHFGAGGSLSLTGGDGASLNFARIESFTGNQTLSGQPSITVTGGSSGGASLEGNFARIQARAAAAVQSIDSGNMTLNAGAAGVSNYAFIGAALQDISVAGNLTLNGGGAAGSLDGTQGGGALIGAPLDAATDLTLDVTGNLTITGGSVAGAAIGAGVAGGAATDLDITVGGDVRLVPGAVPTAGARIGSPAIAPAGGNILIDAVGSITLGTTVGGDTGVITTGDVFLEGNMLSIADKVFGRQVDLYGVAGVSLSGFAQIGASDTGNALRVRLDSGAFSNTASTNPLSAPNGRWLVYSVNPVNDTRGSLAYDFKQYGALPASTVLGSGNGLLYSLPAPSVTAALVGVVSKTYDGTNVATLGAGNYIAAGIDGDVIQLNNPSAGLYDTKGVGTSKQVVAGGLSIASSVDASSRPVFGYNPVVAPASGLVGVISAATITGITGITAADKVYDSTTTATLATGGALFAGRLGDDVLTVASGTGAFANKNVGAAKAVNITGLALAGDDAANYTLGDTTASTTANITAASISAITGITALDKVYDATTAATLATGGAVFVGRLGTDMLNVATGSGGFADKNVGTAKPVNITGLSLGGTDAGNYTLANTTAAGTANITPATLVGVTGITAANKVYDGNTSATLDTSEAVFGGLLGADLVGASGGVGNFADKNAGLAKTVTITGVSLSGIDKDNYVFTGGSTNTTAAITPAVLTAVTGISTSKTYDGGTTVTLSDATAAFAGMLAGDNLRLASALGSFDDANVSTAKPLTVTAMNLGGTDAANYTLSASTGSGTGDITRRALSTWTGLGGNSDWSNPANWDALPSGANVLAVTIPASATVDMNLPGVALQALSSASPVSQSSGSFVTSQLTLNTQAGISLTNPGNAIGTLSASNIGSGDIVLVNSIPITLQAVSNSAGKIEVTNVGAISTVGAVLAPAGNVFLTANSPLTVGAGGVVAGGDIVLVASNLTSTGNMTLNGPITAGNAVFLDAGGSLTQNSAVLGVKGVTADAGLSIVYGPLATANFDPVVYRIDGVVTASPPTETLLGSGAAEATERPVDALVTFVSLLQQASDPAAPPEPDDFNADGTRKKATDDTIVTEGEVCK